MNTLRKPTPPRRGPILWACCLGLMMTASDLPAWQDGSTENGKPSARQWCTWQPADDRSALPGSGKTIVLISGDEEYRSEEALPMLGQMLAERLGFTCHVLFAIDPESGEIDPNQQGNIPGMHLLDEADLVIMALRFRNLPDQQMQHFHRYLNAGKPLIGLRTSTHAFRYPGDYDGPYARYGTDSREWPGGFGKQVLGETWVSHHGHHGSQSTRGVIDHERQDHPWLTGVDDVWGPTDVYGIRELPDNATVLLWGQVIDGMQPDDPAVEGEQNDPMMPLAWVRDYPTESGKVSRVFCTTLGAATDFQSEGLRRLVANAALGLSGREDRIDERVNVDPAGPYEPTDFGFNRFREGLRPADYQD